MIIGADTIVSYKNEILGKPSDEQAAFETLKMLQGNTHQVYTGVTVLVKEEWKMGEIFFCRMYGCYFLSCVQMKKSDAYIAEWGTDGQSRKLRYSGKLWHLCKGNSW